MKEVWKDIKGYEGLYQVSNFGRINCIENLEWCTAKENTKHAYKNKLITTRSEKKKKALLINAKKAWEKNQKKVMQYNLQGKLLKKYESLSSASICNNITIQGISDCCRGKIKTSGGYKWSFE